MITVGPIRRPRARTSERTLGGGGLKQPGVVSRPHGWSSNVTWLDLVTSSRAVESQLRAAAEESPKIVTCCSGGRLCATAFAEKRHTATARPPSKATRRATATNVDALSAV